MTPEVEEITIGRIGAPKRSAELNELAGALALAQGAIENAPKESANPYFRSRYADLASIWDAIRKPLSENGLAVMQLPSVNGAEVTIHTLLAHKSGQWISSDLTMTAQRQLKDGGGWEKLDSPQAVGSVITYARRYALQSIIGVAPEDDDGEGAQGRTRQQQQQDARAAQQRIVEEKLSAGSSAPERPVPEELKMIFKRMAGEPEHFTEACQFMLRKLEDEQGLDGARKYDKIAGDYERRFSKGRRPTQGDLRNCLLDLWDATKIEPPVEVAK